MHVSHTIASIQNCSKVATRSNKVFLCIYSFQSENEMFLSKFVSLGSGVRPLCNSQLRQKTGALLSNCFYSNFLGHAKQRLSCSDTEATSKKFYSSLFMHGAFECFCEEKTQPRYVLKWNLNIAFGCVIITLYLTRWPCRCGWNFSSSLQKESSGLTEGNNTKQKLNLAAVDRLGCWIAVMPVPELRLHSR